MSLPYHVCQLLLLSFFSCILLNKLSVMKYSKNFPVLPDMSCNEFPEKGFYYSSLLVFFHKTPEHFSYLHFIYIRIFAIIHIIKRFPKGCSHFANCFSVSILEFDQVSSVSIVDCEKVNVTWIESIAAPHKTLWNGTYKELNCMYVVFSFFGRVSLKHILYFVVQNLIITNINLVEGFRFHMSEKLKQLASIKTI